jgi:hypothetical protein
MNITDFIGLIGYMGLTGPFILCAALILLTLFLHFHRPQGLEDLAVWVTHAQTILLGLAVFSLGILMQMGAFQYQIVFNAVEKAMSPLERLGGLWSAQATSMLFFSFVLSAAASLSIGIARRVKAAYIKTILLTLEITLIFLLLPTAFFTNPFVKTWMLPSGDITAAVFAPANTVLAVPTDGQGMNPSLRHIAMLLHPPMLYMGLIGLFLPYAFLLAALLQGDDPAASVGVLYPYMLAAWVFLTIGMFLGSWWAYTILGWGGYWGWDACGNLRAGALAAILRIDSFHAHAIAGPIIQRLDQRLLDCHCDPDPVRYPDHTLRHFGIRARLQQRRHGTGANGPYPDAPDRIHLSAGIPQRGISPCERKAPTGVHALLPGSICVSSCW